MAEKVLDGAQIAAVGQQVEGVVHRGCGERQAELGRSAQVPEGGSAFGLSTGPSWGAWWFENMIWGHGGQYSDGWDVTLEALIEFVEQAP